MKRLTQRRLSKTLYYRYFDLSQSSAFLGDQKMLDFSLNMMHIVAKYVKSGELFNHSIEELSNLGIPSRMIDDVKELLETGNLGYVIEYKSRIPLWIHPFITPQYIDLPKLHEFFKRNLISDRSSLRTYFENKHHISSHFEKMLFHALTYMDDTNFPMHYFSKDNPEETPRRYVEKYPIMGTLHNHTFCSDGYCSIDQVKDCGINLQYEYIGISDHSQSTLLGITSKELEQQHCFIDNHNATYSREIYLMKGLECEILRNGELDCTKVEFDRSDYIIAGIHSHYNMSGKEAETRVIKAIESGYVDILAHPSSRIYGSKPGFDMDMKYIIDACISNNVIIEINGNKKRLDLDPKYLDYAANKGAFFEIAADTHNVKDYYRINNAIAMVRDYNIPENQIINTFNKNDLMYLFNSLHNKRNV